VREENHQQFQIWCCLHDALSRRFHLLDLAYVQYCIAVEERAVAIVLAELTGQNACPVVVQVLKPVSLSTAKLSDLPRKERAVL
jgi:hypothetical protein